METETQVLFKIAMPVVMNAVSKDNQLESERRETIIPTTSA